MKNLESKNESFSRFHNAVSITTEKYSYTEWRVKKTDSIYAKMLYDLENDPYEKSNLAEREPKKLKEMTQAMIARLEKEDALYPVDGENELKPDLP